MSSIIFFSDQSLEREIFSKNLFLVIMKKKVYNITEFVADKPNFLFYIH